MKYLLTFACVAMLAGCAPVSVARAEMNAKPPTPAPTDDPIGHEPWFSSHIIFVGERDGCRFYMVRVNDEHVFMHCKDGATGRSTIHYSGGKVRMAVPDEQ